MELGRNINIENGISAWTDRQVKQGAMQARRALLAATREGEWSLPAQGYHVR